MLNPGEKPLKISETKITSRLLTQTFFDHLTAMIFSVSDK